MDTNDIHRDPFSRIGYSLSTWVNERFHLRTWVGVLLIVLAASMCFQAFSLGQDSPEGGLLLNLGTELIGMLLTVVVIERLFEGRKLRDDATRLAMQFLHDIDHVVWVWQGGRRQFSSSELQDILLKAHRDDPIAPCTARLLMDMGDRAARTLRYDPDAVQSSELLSHGLRELEKFIRMRDRDNNVTSAEISARLRNAAYVLAKAADVRRCDSIFPPPPGSVDPTKEQQKKRNAGGYSLLLE
jgi:hypothetical protein